MTFKHITSRDNPIFKQLKRLAESSRERRKEGKTLLDGAHLVSDYMQAFGEPLQLIIAEGQSSREVTGMIQDLSEVPTIMVTTLMFAELSPVVSPTGLLALVNTPMISPPEKIDFALILEDIQDPGNLGSLLRSAAAAGVDVVYLSQGCAEAWSPKALRGGQGAQFRLSIIERADLIAEIESFKQKNNAQVLATTMNGASLYQQDLRGPTAFVMGNEGNGLSPDVIEVSTRSVSVPMKDAVESLNVTSAASVCLFEAFRQRMVTIG
ncbi:MAG TPA: RNA methyltransferase [Methylophilaceae bacterium]|jgi:TrmH family RNA methyltransferase